MDESSNANRKTLSSHFVRWFGMALIVVGALLSPISLVSGLMLMAQVDGSQSATVGGFISLVLLPPLAVVAGLGLRNRRLWALALTQAILLWLVLWNLWHELTTPDGTIYTSSTGEQTIVATPEYSSSSWPFIVLCALALLALLLPAVRLVFDRGNAVIAPLRGLTAWFFPVQQPDVSKPSSAEDDRAAGWRVGHQGRDCMFYEEQHDGQWRRLDISGEMLMGPAHHAIYFDPPTRWREYPEWARHRRDEIIRRIKSRLAPPEYEYYGDDGDTVVATSPRPDHVATAVRPPPTLPQQGYFWSVMALFAVSLFMAWLFKEGLEQGAVRSLARYSRNSLLSRVEDPWLYWLSMILLLLLGLGTAILGIWLTVHRFREGRFSAGVNKES